MVFLALHTQREHVKYHYLKEGGIPLEKRTLFNIKNYRFLDNLLCLFGHCIV
jgi:hypothetical protein